MRIGFPWNCFLAMSETDRVMVLRIMGHRRAIRPSWTTTPTGMFKTDHVLISWMGTQNQSRKLGIPVAKNQATKPHAAL